MKRITFWLVTVAALASLSPLAPPASGHSDGERAPPIFGVTIPPGYRDWKLISVAHEAGNLNDFRAVLGNDAAIKAYRKEKLPFPDGAIIVRLAWSYVPSEENNKVFGLKPSLLLLGGPHDKDIQLMVKDSTEYAATGGWGFAQLNKDGKPADEAVWTKPASHATSLAKLGTLSSPITHLNAERK